ncbi:syntaxin [Panaeolus papilionaceus]|nr:syntaxin [Panaeolus papilionaceus]
MTAIQAVFIRGFEERSKPKPHTVYEIDVQAQVRSWQMWRRYSEFDDLHTALTKSTGSPPPAPLPPKQKFSLIRSHSDAKLLEERRNGLEAYLRAIISAKDDKWRETHAFKTFLGVPLGKQPLTTGGTESSSGDVQFSFSSWLDEHAELQTRLRDVWADINKRDALSDRGDVPAAHRSNVAAKAKLAGVLSRIGVLGQGLQELAMKGMSEGELQRRTDMVARLQDDCEKLGKVVSVARHALARPGTTSSAASSAIDAASQSDRDALMGAASSKPVRRVFGAPPAETEITRPLDDTGLLNLQQTQVQQQDNQLSKLTTILTRQKQLGQAISSEIALQIEMLDDLGNEVDRVGGKLDNADRQLNKIS